MYRYPQFTVRTMERAGKRRVAKRRERKMGVGWGQRQGAFLKYLFNLNTISIFLNHIIVINYIIIRQT